MFDPGVIPRRRPGRSLSSSTDTFGSDDALRYVWMMHTSVTTTPPLHLDLQGRWFITRSNFPMWLTGKKTNPTFNYSIDVDRRGRPVLLDRVIALKNGRPDTISGIDTPLDDEPGAFLWRGTGLLKLVTSRWRIKLLDDTKQFAVVHFEKTLFTPEGYDVVCRVAVPDAALDAAIDAALQSLGITATLTPILQT